MQLFFETERTPDINDMSTLEETVDEKLITDAIMDSLKHISNGNKENIQKPDNISRNENKLIDKLNDEELNDPIVAVDLEEITEKNHDENIVTKENNTINNSGEYTNDDLHGTTESYDSCKDSEEDVQLETKQYEYGQEDVSNKCNNEKNGELQQIKQEVNDILAQKASNLKNSEEQEEAHEPKNIAEESHDDRMKEATANLIQSIETGQVLEASDLVEESPCDISAPVEIDDTSPINNVAVTSDPEVADGSKLTEEVTYRSDIIEEVELENAGIDDTCPKTESDKQGTSCMEILTIQDENDIVDKTVPEPTYVDKVCKEIDMTSDKEDNDITLLDSPVYAEVQKNEEDNITSNTAMDCDDISLSVDKVPEVTDKTEGSHIIDKESTPDATFVASKDEVMIIDKEKETSQKIVEEKQETPPQTQIEKEPEKNTQKSSPVLCRLSNSLNILSDDEDEPPIIEPPKDPTPEKQCINLEDDDDIMLIDEDTNSKDSKTEKTNSNKTESTECQSGRKQKEVKTDLETGENTNISNAQETVLCTIEEAPSSTSSTSELCVQAVDKKNSTEEASGSAVTEKPLLPDNFLKSSRKNIADMTRDDLEEFCILKIVESIVDRSNLSDIKTKLKAMAQNLEDYKKKAMMLTKQNKDLEIVLKSVQEEQKRSNGSMVTPLKITRSVGMQVYMTDKLVRKKSLNAVPAPPVPTVSKTRSATNTQPKPSKMPSSPTIPVPRLIPANNAATRGPVPQNSPVNTAKQLNTVQVNGVRNLVPAQKSAEKRPIGKSQSVTVDLTDDEPPAKIASRGPTPPVRLVPSQNLMPPQRPQFGQTMNTPRKVYIPISTPQGQQMKPGQTIMVKTSPTAPNRQRPMAPTITRLTTNQMRMNRVGPATPRHPAALPDVVKQYQPPNWKALPPAPDLKLSKVENGIVISWKIEGYQEDSYEEIASYQLYAYQETSSPPSTALWKKIGDVKALPLPMACTLTQFMAGFKYYFAVRAVDVKSRVGPFSLPGSILLLNKM